MNPFKPWWQLNGFTRVRGVDRFWRKVRIIADPTSCWPWLNGRTGSGYGEIHWHGKMLRAHRLAYELVNGPIPPGQLVRHACDNPLCCRPSHLIAGTHADNMADKAARGRGRHNVLNLDQVAAIRASTARVRDLCALYNVVPTTIYYIRRGKTYRADPSDRPDTSDNPPYHHTSPSPVAAAQERGSGGEA